MSDVRQVEIETVAAGSLAGAVPVAALAAASLVGSRRPSVFRRFRRNPLALAGLVVLVGLIIVAVAAPIVAPDSWSRQHILQRFLPPVAGHPFGTDELGRDELARIAYGAHISLLIGFVAILASLVPGGLGGLLAGYYPRVDGVLMRVIDVMMAFPGILLAIAIVAALGPSVPNVIIAIAVNEIPGFVRLIRSSVLSLREREYVIAARALGARDRRIILWHIGRNALSPIIVYTSLRIPVAILTGATLSFLGLGVQPPQPEWGAMLSTARQYIDTDPYTFLFPTIAVLLTVLAFNFIGDGLRDALDADTLG